MIIFFLFNSTSTKTSPSFHSTLSFLLLSCTHLFFSPQVSSLLTERAVSQPFLALKRAFLLLSNGCLPSDTMPPPPKCYSSQSWSWLWDLCLWKAPLTTDSSWKVGKIWHPSAVQRKVGVRNRSLSLAICMALDEAGPEHSYL